VTDPRVERSRRRGREAALAELVDRGLGGFQVESVAARAGLGKSTIYRLWGDGRSLVLDALEHLSRQPPPPPGGGSPRRRVHDLVSHLVTAWGPGSPTGDALPALADAAARDPELGAAVRAFSASRMAALVTAVGDAAEAGEARAGTDPALAARALAGAVLVSRLLGPAPLEEADVDPLLETVLGPPPP
jgi:TetR/AcrR family transcriptional regulator, regulator of autoinduction and epiphytic fitness